MVNLLKWNTSRQELDQVSRLKNYIRVPSLTCSFNGHRALHNI